MMCKIIFKFCVDESLERFLLELTQNNFLVGMWGDDSWGKTGTEE